MQITFVSSRSFESWNWRNPDNPGIGGSETSHVEMSNRLAKLGHDVHSYAPCDFAKPVTNPYGVKWQDCSQIDCNRTGLWIIYRDAVDLIDHLPDSPENAYWLVCQDVDYEGLTPERAKRFSRIIALCSDHQSFLQRKLPGAQVVESSNGIKTELIRKIYEKQIQRNPLRLMYASSPDRGMEYLLKIFPRAKEIVGGLELHIYYGFDNIEKIAGKFEQVGKNMDRLKSMIEQPGVHWHGRLGQPQLLEEWFKAGIWCHPSNFLETSCITSMDAQACGAIPITNPVWAVERNVQHGVLIEGDVRDETVQARYVHQIVSLALQPDVQSRIRETMMTWAQWRFDWRNYVKQWEEWARADVRQEVAA